MTKYYKNDKFNHDSILRLVEKKLVIVKYILVDTAIYSETVFLSNYSDNFALNLISLADIS